MTSAAIKKQVNNYLPLLSDNQQTLVLEMIKSFLNVDKDTRRISRKQYNKEINEAVARIEKGNSVSQKDAQRIISVVKATYKIIWDKKALDHFKDILTYLQKHSDQAPKIVKSAVITRIGLLKTNPLPPNQTN